MVSSIKIYLLSLDINLFTNVVEELLEIPRTCAAINILIDVVNEHWKSLFGQQCELHSCCTQKYFLMRLLNLIFFLERWALNAEQSETHNQDIFTRASSNFMKTNLHKHYARLFQCWLVFAQSKQQRWMHKYFCQAAIWIFLLCKFYVRSNQNYD